MMWTKEYGNKSTEQRAQKCNSISMRKECARVSPSSGLSLPCLMSSIPAQVPKALPLNMVRLNLSSLENWRWR